MATLPTMKDFIVELLAKKNREVTLDEIYEEFDLAGYTTPLASIRGRLNSLANEGRIRRVSRGNYASLEFDANGDQAGQYYSLLMTASEGEWDHGSAKTLRSRFLEYTDDKVRDQFASLDQSAQRRLLDIPAIFAYESGVKADARVGHLRDIVVGNDVIAIYFEFDASIPPIPSEQFFRLREELHLGKNEEYRTHWAIKEVDLFLALSAAGLMPRPVDEAVLVQRPSSHRFDRVGGRIEAFPVKESPFDPILAEAIVGELREKALEAVGALSGNNADDVVVRAVERLLQTLHSSVSDIAEGVLLMRANTIGAHKRAYADPISERERNIRAILDDLSISVDNLVDCYPGIRQINANRLALDMQSADAPEIESNIEKIADLARHSPVVGRSASAALDIGRDDVRDLTEKLDRETSSLRTADYVATLGQIVASRLLDATNFASSTLQNVGSELSAISADTWKEIRKSLPKSVGRGLSKGTEQALETLVARGPLAVLAYHLGGPLAALAVLVPRLKAHAQKADEIKSEIQRSLEQE